MAGEGDGRERLAGASAKNSGKDLVGKDSKQDARQDRLKLALRQNLKRRKSQARGRDDVASAASDREEASSYREVDKADRE
jgi:hypothetical protein